MLQRCDKEAFFGLFPKRHADLYHTLRSNITGGLSIVFTNYKLRSPRCDIQLRYNSNCIQSSAKIRYLGVVIDHKLIFLPHIQNLEAKVSRNIRILFQLNKVLPISALKTLYYALVHPLLFYGIIIWDLSIIPTSVTNLSIILSIIPTSIIPTSVTNGDLSITKVSSKQGFKSNWSSWLAYFF